MNGANISSTLPKVTIANPVYANGSVAVTSQTYLQSVAEGYIPGHYLYSKLGYSPASGITQTTLWGPGTEYVFPTGATAVEAVSSSASDTSAGTGARTVTLLYLDTLYAEKTHTFTLNGTTPVAGPTDVFRANGLYVITAGSVGKTVGNISLQLVGGAATIYQYISAGFTRGKSSVYTVPAGKSLYVDNIAMSAAYKTTGKTVRMTYHTSRNPLGVVSTSGLIFWPYFEPMLVDYGIACPLTAPLVFPEKTDTKVSVIGETLAQTTSLITGWLK